MGIETKKPLYQEGNLAIAYDPEDHEDYTIRIGYAYFHMPGKILRELSETTGLAKIKEKLHSAYHGQLEFCLEKNDLSVADIALAISQARNRELEQKLKVLTSKTGK